MRGIQRIQTAPSTAPNASGFKDIKGGLVADFMQPALTPEVQFQEGKAGSTRENKQPKPYLDPGCPSFFGVLSYISIGYIPQKVGHPGSR